MSGEEFCEFDEGAKRNARLANRHAHAGDRIEHPGGNYDDMPRRGFNSRQRTVPGPIDAFAPHPPLEKRVVRVMHGHKLADMGRMTLRWPAGSTASLSASMIICPRTRLSMKPLPPMNTPSPQLVAASDDPEKTLTSAPPSGRGAFFMLRFESQRRAGRG